MTSAAISRYCSPLIATTSRPSLGALSVNETVVLNDVQSQLNPTPVHRVFQPKMVDEVAQAISESRRTGRPISVAGGRHSMGGQQFGRNALHLDMTEFNQVVRLDKEHGQATVEAGIQWPKLIEDLHR